MPVIETQREDMRHSRGVHLYHFATSNCSQRVRLVLEEKQIGWVSHHVDLVKCENATPDFIAINPNGVVPVLVHDGATIIESNDIIAYLDEHFEAARLGPTTPQDEMYVHDALTRSSEYQDAFRLLMHEFVFKPFRRMSEEQLGRYAAGVRNEKLISFMTEFSSDEGFSTSRIAEAIEATEGHLSRLEERLDQSPWLTGTDLGIADISWVVNIYRLARIDYPLEHYPLVQGWLTRLMRRPSFRCAVTRYEPLKVRWATRIYTQVRRIQRSSVRHVVAQGVG